METKLFEVRDRATFIPCFGILMTPLRSGAETFDAEAFLLRRAGYGFDQPLVLFGRLEGGAGGCQYDPYDWSAAARTMRWAHRYVAEHWSELTSGSVIDVEFILGETKAPKVSEGRG
jgi:hypothetical protein